LPATSTQTITDVCRHFNHKSRRYEFFCRRTRVEARKEKKGLSLADLARLSGVSKVLLETLKPTGEGLEKSQNSKSGLLCRRINSIMQTITKKNVYIVQNWRLNCRRPVPIFGRREL
jgi:hypothetical protein